MKTTSLESMCRARRALPTLTLLLAVALLFWSQHMHAHAAGLDEGPAEHQHVEMVSPADDTGEHHEGEGTGDCSVSSCSLCLAVIPAPHAVSAVAATPSGPSRQNAAQSGRPERLYRPPILRA